MKQASFLDSIEQVQALAPCEDALQEIGTLIDDKIAKDELDEFNDIVEWIPCFEDDEEAFDDETNTDRLRWNGWGINHPCAYSPASLSRFC